MSSLKLLAWLAPVLPLVMAAPALAQDAADSEPQLDVQRVYTPLSAERFDQMIPKHPGYLGALAPEEMEDLLATTVLKEFKTRLGRLGLEYQTPARP